MSLGEKGIIFCYTTNLHSVSNTFRFNDTKGNGLDSNNVAIQLITAREQKTENIRRYIITADETASIKISVSNKQRCTCKSS